MDDYTEKGVYDCAFVDVPRAAPYFDDIAYMSGKGLVTAGADKRFRPDALVTRGELAAIMARMQGLKEKEIPALKKVSSRAPVTRAEFVIAVNRMTGRTATEPPRTGLPTFSDVNSAHPAYADIMRAATTYLVPATK